MVAISGIIDEEPFDAQTWSGSSKYLFETLEKLNSLSSAHSATPSKVVSYSRKVANFNPNMEKWRFKYHLDTKYFNAMSAVAKEKLSIIPDNDFDTILQVGAWYDLSAYKGKKTLASYHDGNLARLLASPYGHPAIDKKYTQRALQYEKNLYNKMDLIFPMSQWLAESFVEDFGISRDKIIPIGAGINLPKVRETANKVNKGKTLLMVGKDFQRKGGEVLLRAFARARKTLPHIHLRIIGPVLPSIPDGVSCPGFISKNTESGVEALLSEYENADLYVLPSIYEPFGISLPEAMAHRLPCIGTDNCAIPEIILDNKTGLLVPVNDEKALAKAIIEILSDTDKAQSFGEAGYKHYNENFRWEAVCKKMIDAIKSHQSSL